jgi:hypothetical protein
MKRLFLFLTVAAAVCCAACSDDPEVAESNLSLLEDNVTFDMFGGRSVLEITADSPWTVSCDDDWCRTNVAEGSHTKKIVLTVDQSFLPEERTTAVRFYAAGEEKHTVTVTQEKFEPILVLAENGADITVYGAGSEPALNLRASVAWKIEGATDWCAVSQSEGTKSSVVKLLLTDDGEGVRPRSATLTVSSEMEGVEPQQVDVVHLGGGAFLAGVIQDADLDFNADEICFRMELGHLGNEIPLARAELYPQIFEQLPPFSFMFFTMFQVDERSVIQNGLVNPRFSP